MKIEFSRTAALALVVAMTGTLIGGSAAAAVAVPAGTHVSVASAQLTDVASTPIPSTEFAPATSPVHALNGYVSFSEDGYSIDAPASVLAQIPRAALDDLNAYMARVNSDVKSGKLVMSAEGVATPAAAPSLKATTVAAERAVAARSRHGYIKSHWYGVEVGLDSWLTNKVEGGTWTASGAAGLAAILGGGEEAGVVAAALATAAGAIQVCQHQDGWTILYWLGAISPTAFVCNPFG